MADTHENVLPEKTRKALFRFAYTVGDEDDWQDRDPDLVDDDAEKDSDKDSESPTRH